MIEVVAIERLAVGLVAVPVRAQDGTEMTFLLDTGAGVSTISPAAAEHLGVERGRTVRAQAVGGVLEIPLGECPGLYVGGTLLPPIEVAVLELPPDVAAQLGRPIDGILGRSFFDATDVHLDLQAGALALYPAGRIEELAEGPGQRFHLVRGVMSLRADVGRGVEPVVLDIGANGSVVNRSFAQETGAPIRPELAQMQGADGRPTPTSGAVSLGTVRLAGAELADVEAAVCEDLVCRAFLGHGRANLGIDAVDGKRIWLSYRDRRLWIADALAPTAGPAPPSTGAEASRSP